MSKKYRLDIDTSQIEKTIVGLFDGKTNINKVTKSRLTSSQSVLPAINEMLQQSGIIPDQISQISVNTGPGSFTGLRVGITVAQIMGLVLGIEVNHKPAGKTIHPKYNPSQFD